MEQTLEMFKLDKKSFILGGVFFFIVLTVFGMGVAVGTGSFVEFGNLVLQLDVVLPETYRTELEALDEVERVDISDFGSEIFTTIESIGGTDEEIAFGLVGEKMERYFRNLEGSNLDGVPSFSNKLLPFACPKDFTTQVVSGLYLLDSTIFVDPGDTQGRCP